jgi:putative (di)nucleoside polyphosphate hydrolase
MMAVDAQGFRPNVGIIVCNADNQLLFAKRAGLDAWQFPQGGIKAGESLEEAMYRELQEEIGLHPEDVMILGQTEEWVSYLFGSEKKTSLGERYVGQKQIWFLLRLLSDDSRVVLTNADHHEFDAWQWVDYDYPVNHIVAFKKPIYEQTLAYFRPILFPDKA